MDENVFLIRNRWQTPDGTILESTEGIEFIAHVDRNRKYYSVDGGTNYIKIVGDGLKNLCVYSNDSFEKIRENHYFNCFITLKWLPLKDLKDEQIDLLISKNNKYKEFYIKEKKYRENEN